MLDFLLIASFSLMIAHELDAIDKKEWRIFPGTNLLPDDLGYKVFTILHVPLVGFLIWALFLAAPETTQIARSVFAGFSIAHIGAHYLYRNHKEYRFNNLFSNALIWGSGLFGAAYLIAGLL